MPEPTNTPAAAPVVDLDAAESALRLAQMKLTVHNLPNETVRERLHVQKVWETRGLIADALRAIGRHVDQKEAASRAC